MKILFLSGHVPFACVPGCVLPVSFVLLLLFTAAAVKRMWWWQLNIKTFWWQHFIQSLHDLVRILVVTVRNLSGFLHDSIQSVVVLIFFSWVNWLIFYFFLQSTSAFTAGFWTWFWSKGSSRIALDSIYLFAKASHGCNQVKAGWQQLRASESFDTGVLARSVLLWCRSFELISTGNIIVFSFRILSTPSNGQHLSLLLLHERWNKWFVYQNGFLRELNDILTQHTHTLSVCVSVGQLTNSPESWLMVTTFKLFTTRKVLQEWGIPFPSVVMR